MKSMVRSAVPASGRKQGATAKVTRGVLVGLSAVLFVGVSSIAIASVQFDRTVAREVDEIFARERGVRSGVITEADIIRLPEPVQRWLRYSGMVGNERIATVRLKQRGQMRSAADKPWMPIVAEQYYTTNPPAFVWSAKAIMAPGIWARVRDKHVEGTGNILVKALGLITIDNKKGPDLDHDTLLRYLNEIMWFPSAALSDYIAWEPIDARSAKATMTYHNVTGSAVFYFDDQGRITNMIAERYAGSNGELVPWQTPITAYGEFHGVRVPTAGEAIYKLPSGDFTYGRIELTELEYNKPSQY